MKIKGLSEILPKDLSESSVNEIIQIIEDTVRDRVSEEIKSVEAKVKAFIRLKINELKEHALTELQEEDSMYRNSKLFEHVKSVVALEIGKEDNDSSISGLLEEKNAREAEFTSIAEKLSKVLEENEKLTNAIITINSEMEKMEDQVLTLEEENNDLADSNKRLNESSKKPFLSSEKAKIISENVEVKKDRKIDNPFLTEEVMEHMPFTSRKG